MSACLLAVDTATEICGVALVVDGLVKAELILNHGVTHTQCVMEAIDTVLSISSTNIRAVDAYAVTRGPGSFTGLRIGISTVKGLALAAGKPIVGVSTLEVLGHQASGDDILVCPLIDARRNELYWTLYRRDDVGLSPVLDEQVGSVDTIAGKIDGPCYFIGNGVAQYQSRLKKKVAQPTHWANEALCGIRPSVVGRLAWRRFLEGNVEDLSKFTPIYLRKSDAELSRKAGPKTDERSEIRS